MAFSTIIKKPCKCGCGKMPTMGYAGYNAACRPDIAAHKLKNQQSKQQQAYKALPKKEKRTRNRQIKSTIRGLIDTPQNKEMIPKISGGSELQRWFEERRKEMTGKCLHCGGISCKLSDQYYKHSIAHLLPKKLFKSVATHPDNWLELCFWNNSCHTNLDDHMIDLIDLNCFDLVIQKFVKILPHIAKEEKRFIPKVLLEYAENEK